MHTGSISIIQISTIFSYSYPLTINRICSVRDDTLQVNVCAELISETPVVKPSKLFLVIILKDSVFFTIGFVHDVK